MAFLKGVILFIVALTMALSLSITLVAMQGRIAQQQDQKTLIPSFEDKIDLKLPSKRVSRFLAQNLNPRNPNAADHCHKDHEICYLEEGKTNSTCCNNKCVDLAYDNKNCRACKNKCKFTQTCCRGECVELAYDKRHCGYCNHRCNPGEYCVYGLCNYA